MAEGRGSNNLRLYIITLTFSLIFPVLGYTFTNLPGNIGEYDISIDEDTLMRAGITLRDAENHDLTWGGGFEYYNVSGNLYRSAWDSDWRDPWITPIGDGVVVERPGIFEWWDASKVRVTSAMASNTFKVITNASIVSEYDINYNWTKYTTDTGFIALIQPFTRGVSINTAVYDEAHLNVTIGSALVEDSNFNFRQFSNWYFSMLVGNQSFGLPSVFSWMVRLISAISVLSAILLAKELISL